MKIGMAAATNTSTMPATVCTQSVDNAAIAMPSRTTAAASGPAMISPSIIDSHRPASALAGSRANEKIAGAAN